MSDEKPPDTVPVPTPPPSGERAPDISVRGRRRRSRRGRSRKEAPGRSIEEIVTDVEKKEGEAPAEMVLIVVRSYRALQATNEAQKEVIRKLGEELAVLKKRPQ